MPNVTNPMKTDLDAAGYNISSVHILGATVLSAGGAEVYGGGDDPSVGFDGSVGSLYLRRRTDAQGIGHGELWLKTGIQTTDWQKVAG